MGTLPLAEDFCVAPFAVVLAAAFFAPPGCGVLVPVFFTAPCFAAPFLAAPFFAASLIAPPFLALPFAGLTLPLVANLVAPLAEDWVADFAADLVEAPLAADCLDAPPLVAEALLPEAVLPVDAALPPDEALADEALAGEALVEDALAVIPFAVPLPALLLAPCVAVALLLPLVTFCAALPDGFDGAFAPDFDAVLVLDVLPVEVFVPPVVPPDFDALLVAAGDAFLLA